MTVIWPHIWGVLTPSPYIDTQRKISDGFISKACFSFFSLPEGRQGGCIVSGKKLVHKDGTRSRFSGEQSLSHLSYFVDKIMIV